MRRGDQPSGGAGEHPRDDDAPLEPSDNANPFGEAEAEAEVEGLLAINDDADEGAGFDPFADSPGSEDAATVDGDNEAIAQERAAPSEEETTVAADGEQGEIAPSGGEEEEDDDVAFDLHPHDERLEEVSHSSGEESAIPPPPPRPENGWSDESSSEPAEESGDEEAERNARDDELFEDVAFVMGQDKEGHRLIVVYPREAARLLATVAVGAEERLVNFMVRLLTRVSKAGRYTVVVHCTGAPELVSNRARMCWLLAKFARLQRLPHRKYLHRLVLVHPYNGAQSLIWLFYPFVSRKFWRKLVFATRLSELAPIVEGQGVWPPYVLEGDKNPPRPGNARSFDGFWKVSRPFGVSAEVLADKTPFGLPMMVVRCIDYLCAHGIKVQGLFRVPGNGDDVDNAKRRLETGKDIDVGGVWSQKGRPSTPEHVYIVTALLKSFFRDLKPPILTPAAYKDILLETRASSDNLTLASTLAQIVSLLPPHARATLAFLMYFLNYVALHVEFNQMTEPNLAIVWAPNILRDAEEGANEEELTNITFALRATTTMIMHCRVVFPLQTVTRLPRCLHQETGEPLPLNEVLVQDATAKSEGDSNRQSRSGIGNSTMSSGYGDEDDAEQDEDDVDELQGTWNLTSDDIAAISLAELRARIKARGRDPAMYVITQADLCRHLDLDLRGEKEKEHRRMLARAESMPIRQARAEFSISLVREEALLRELGRNNPVSEDALRHMSNKELKTFLISKGLDPTLCPMRPELVAEAVRAFRLSQKRPLSPPPRPGSQAGKRRSTSPLLVVRASVVEPEQKTASFRSQRSLKPYARDLLDDANSLVPVQSVAVDTEDALLDAIDIDEQQLKHEPLFAQFQENAVAVQALEAYVAERRKLHADYSKDDIATMGPDELRALIEHHGFSHGDCKGVGALRMRARECFDDDDIVLEGVIGLDDASPNGGGSKSFGSSNGGRSDSQGSGPGSGATSAVGGSTPAQGPHQAASANISPLLRAMSASLARSASSSGGPAKEVPLKRTLFNKRPAANSGGSGGSSRSLA